MLVATRQPQAACIPETACAVIDINEAGGNGLADVLAGLGANVLLFRVLRSRGLGRKRSLAMREFLLVQEALRRFIAREPLRRIHEAVFAVRRWRASRSIPGCNVG
jgi:hypothetical protein